MRTAGVGVRAGGRVGLAAWLSWGLLLAASGCRTASDLAPVRLDDPGWSVRHGQAVWVRALGADGVAGELLVATGPEGACWVEFSKPPFGLATARSEREGWSLVEPGARLRKRGSGAAPAGAIWFALAGATRGTAPGGGWRFETGADGGWRLWQPETGESLEGYWAP
ncbi:MAG: hypothetical protein JNL97_06055 [Verrucomicrobiales bacterium]|nr:hypothetical protein [Verrucomicrobiales bacterium]